MAGEHRERLTRESVRERGQRAEHVAAIQALKERDNTTNFLHLAVVYVIMAVTIATTIWSFGAVSAAGLGWWWNIPASLLAIIVMGGSQHQLAGAVHEASHFMLFKNRLLNELAGDWLAAFPIYTTSYQYRVQHLAHHQFVNDPVRDPDISQLKESEHWLDFPMPQIEFLREVVLLLLPWRLVRYTITRARYSSVGFEGHAYFDRRRAGSPWPVRLGLLFAVGVLMVVARLSRWGMPEAVIAVLLSSWVGIVAYYLFIPQHAFPATRLEPVISHRMTAISRISYLAFAYGVLATLHLAGYGAWNYFMIFWLAPLFTTFPLFMVLRQLFQHGNCDRGRFTNSHDFLVNPLVRYCIFPWGQDFHLSHHLQASIPHFNLRKLHALMLDDPEYVEKGSVLSGFFSDGGKSGILAALECVRAASAGAWIHVDNATLEYAELSDAEAVRHEAELSQRAR